MCRSAIQSIQLNLKNVDKEQRAGINQSRKRFLPAPEVRNDKNGLIIRCKITLQFRNEGEYGLNVNKRELLIETSHSSGLLRDQDSGLLTFVC